MPADEVHHGTGAEEPRARSGPRHAAPKKPLLTRLHIPAGKAIAIAAMPTAVLMGMGLTPELAQAKPGVPKNPFRDGPCVTAPDKDADEGAADKARDDKRDGKQDGKRDEPSGTDKDADKDGANSSPSPTPSPSAGDKGGSGDRAEPSPTPSSGSADKGDSKDGDKDSGKDGDKPAPDPSPSETRNPWDPLGVGDALHDIFTPGDKDKGDEDDEGKGEKESATPTPTPSKSEDSKDGAKDGAADKRDAVKDTVDKVTKPVRDTADKVGDEADKAKDKADDAAEPDASVDPMAPDENGKKPFPCVVEKKVDGKDEQTPATIPDDPWLLEASSLLLKGADYQGVVNLTTASGKKKQALKYVVSNGVDIGDLHQITTGPGGRKFHLTAAKGSTSTMRGPAVTMLTERISGKLFGLIPVTFDPEHPPPLNIPLIYFTDVKVQQAGQFDGNLTIPGLHQSISD